MLIYQFSIFKVPSLQRHTMPGNSLGHCSLCVVITTAVPSLRMEFSSSMTWRPFSMSRFAVGSSANSSLGLLRRARAMHTRCCSPPDNSWGRWRVFSGNPTCSRTSMMRRSRSTFLFHPVARSTKSRFSSTVRSRNNWKSWNTIPN